MSSDILDRLAVYAPTPTSVAGEWGPTEREQGLAAVFERDLTDSRTRAHGTRRLRFVPGPGAQRTRAIAPIAASVAVLVLAGGVAVVADREHGAGGAGVPAGQPGTPSDTGTDPLTATAFRATVDTPRLGAHQWAYRAVSSYEQTSGPGGASPSATGRSFPSMVWVAADGSGQSRSDGDNGGPACRAVSAVHSSDVDEPTQQLLDDLPTDPDALKSYLTKRVQGGSTSREEAIFVMVGDLLRGGDLLASSAQRAALVTVLAGLGRTSVHEDVDARGRPAVRVDFVDPNQRADEIQSLYFDPKTFQLLEERSSDSNPTKGVPTDEPSAPYTSVPSAKPDSPQQLPAAASIEVMTTERAVDSLPTNCGLK